MDSAQLRPRDPTRPLSATQTTAVFGAAAVGAVAISHSARVEPMHVAGSDTLKIGLIGCGGRGCGAAVNAAGADGNCKVVALADVFPDRLQAARRNLERNIGKKYAVKEEHCFVGFDAYKQLLATEVDVVLLATPPHFRPIHLRAAIEAGKHVFAEKPVAVDAPGVRSVIETAALAKEKSLSIVSGLCFRYDHAARATVEKIHSGAIGDIIAIQSDYLTGSVSRGQDRPEWSRMEYQIRNWQFYTWLSGDHIVEQHVHSSDRVAWLLGETYPVAATGMGGRQQRVDPKFGHIFDHHAVAYEFANGVRAFSYTRQQDGCSDHVDEIVMGSRGTAQLLKGVIKGPSNWKYRGRRPNMYDVEHEELFASIRLGEPINDGVNAANSTMIAIMGRMATYTGKTITWEQALNSTERLGPEHYEWGDVAEPAVAVPGFTQLS